MAARAVAVLVVAAVAVAAATALAERGPEPGPVRTTGDFAPLWSPDGNAIAFARVEESAGDPDEAALYVLDLATGSERRLGQLDLEASSYAWSADGTRLGFGRSGDQDRDLATVRSIRPDGTGARRLARGAWFVGYSTAGETVVSACDGSYRYAYCVLRVGVPGTFQNPSGCFVAEPRFATLSAACRHRGFSPDGRRSVTSTGGPDSVVLVIGAGSEVLTIGEGAGPQWSPDGESIAFLTRTADGLRLAVMRPDGSGRRVVSDSPAALEQPQWSPDGRLIAFGVEAAGQEQLAVARADGTGSTTLTSEPGGLADNPPAWPRFRWSPTGERLAYFTDAGLLSVRPDGGGRAVVIPAGPVRLGWLSWSPDGTRISFSAPGGRACPGHYTIYVVAVDGTGRVSLTGPCSGGGPRGDELDGTGARNLLFGNRGADTVHGRGGPDHIAGGPGRDRLYGDSGPDQLEGGPDGDRIFGGLGDDIIVAHEDGVRDVISCGSGRDEVRADRVDAVARDCERVRRY